MSECIESLLEALKRAFDDLAATFAEIVRFIADGIASVVHGMWKDTLCGYGVYSGRCSERGNASGMWHIKHAPSFLSILRRKNGRR